MSTIRSRNVNSAIHGDFRPGYSQDPRETVPTTALRQLILPIAIPHTDAKIQRRRDWAADGSIPPRWRHRFTEGQRAVIAVVLRQITDFGYCDWCVDKIANVAGVCKRTAQYALAIAEKSGLITRIKRRISWVMNAPSIIKAKCSTLIAWLNKRRKFNKPKPIGCKPVHGKKTDSYKTAFLKRWEAQQPPKPPPD